MLEHGCDAENGRVHYALGKDKNGGWKKPHGRRKGPRGRLHIRRTSVARVVQNAIDGGRARTFGTAVCAGRGAWGLIYRREVNWGYPDIYGVVPPDMIRGEDGFRGLPIDAPQRRQIRTLAARLLGRPERVGPRFRAAPN